MKSKIYRQGDVLITQVNEIPKTKQPVPRENGKIVLAHGEVTGHAHAISAKNANLFSDSGVTYLEVKKALAMLTHEEHSTVNIPPGKYLVIRQREYMPDQIRRVAD